GTYPTTTTTTTSAKEPGYASTISTIFERADV
ncbi:hypothetical protein V496_08610, partial [Pseudogymnoascus sp. VKM F-4515 (FW-2607)]